MTMYQGLGVDVTETSTTIEHKLGNTYTDEDGKQYVYVQADASGITGAGYVALVDEGYSADMIDTTNSGTGFGQLVGVAPAAFAASAYGWLQVGGVCVVRVAASCAANTAINTTATAGQLDDDATTGAEVVNRIVLTTANGGSAGTAAGLVWNPTVGNTL